MSSHEDQKNMVDSEGKILPESSIVSNTCRFLRNLIQTVKESADGEQGTYIGYESNDRTKAEERIYLVDPDSGLRWSVTRTFIIANPGAKEAKNLESFSISAREKISSEPVRLLTRDLLIMPFLPSANGEMGDIFAGEHVEQIQADGTKALVMFDTITRTAMLFKRIGKRYADMDAKRQSVIKNVRELLNKQLNAEPKYSEAVLNTVETIIRDGLDIYLPALYSGSASTRSNDTIRPLHPTSSQLLHRGIGEVVSEMVQQEVGDRSFVLPTDIVVGISDAIFEVLIGKWSQYLEQEHGDFIRRKEGNFEIPALEPSETDKVLSRISDRWAEIGRCFKTSILSDQEVEKMLALLSRLHPAIPSQGDLQVTESDEMLVAHNRIFIAQQRYEAVKIIRPIQKQPN